MTRRADVTINGVFMAQEVSGQQRYARGIVDQMRLDSQVLVPEPPWTRAPAGRHAWTNTRFRWERTRVALSLTHQFPWRRPRCDAEVLTIHDLFPIEHPEWYSKGYAAYASRLLRTGIERADLLVAVSEPAARQIRDQFSPRAPVTVVPNAPAGIFFAEVDDTDEEVLDSLGLYSGQYILTLASDDPRKRLDLVIAAHEASDQAGLPLVAAGTAPAMVAHDAEVLRGRSGRLVVTGRVDDGQLAALYRHAAVFVTASDAEGFGLPAVEAATAGTPVIASDLPVHRWTLGEFAHYFDRGSRESLVDAMNDAAKMVPPIEPYRRFTFSESARQIDVAVTGLLNG